MAGYKLSEHIDSSPDSVFEFVSDPENAPTWLPGVTRMEPITDGPVGVGAKLRETRQVRQRTGSVEMEVTAFDPPARYSTSFMMGEYRASYEYSFRPEGSGTLAEFTCVVRGSGLRSVLAPLIAMAMKRQDSGQMAMLKQAIEGGRQVE